jgi:para-nitrobenzyl esterase
MTTVTGTRHGEVEGVQREGYVSFKGIPYAAPPIGERRWLPPQPVNPWSGTLQAQSYGFVAPQPERVADAPLAMLGTEVGEEREDCLYLNVWTPAIDDRKRPVMVWIHGGGFRSGTGGSPLYSPRFLLRRGDVVVVTLNYRLGALGFLNLNEVTRGRIPSTGNEGLLDQIAALRWVRDNIAAFGGDPDQVTVFGESAGGMSVGALLGAPAARGLFQRAIPQSGAASTARTLERAAYVAERFLEKIGLQPHDCDGLRALDPRRLIEVEQALSLPVDPLIGGVPCEPVIDGQVLPQLPLEAVRAGSADGISLLVGSTLDEWRLFLAMDPRGRKLDESGLAHRLNRRVADADLRPLAEAYRRAREARGEDTRPRELFSAIQTDRVFRVPAIRLAEAMASRGNAAYSYLFTWPSPAFDGVLGSCHAIELGFVWGTHDLTPGMGQFFGTGSAATALSAATQEAWLAFARGGDPSCEPLGRWPSYTEESRETMLLGEKCVVEAAPCDEERRAWEGFEDGPTLGRL